MALSETAKRKLFGNAVLQQERDWSGPAGNLLYEGYASPGISTATAGWVIFKHSFDVDDNDTQSRPKIGVIWELRDIYDYDIP